MTTKSNRPTPEFLRQQIAEFREERSVYQTFADALKRVFEAACQPCLPDAIVQARAKAVPSFAEKCVRKFNRYPDPVRRFTDLCGGRIIVQTLTQVDSVRRFVEENFRVVETEDVGLRLGEKEFGYRDRHYIVQLRRDRAEGIGFRPDEIRAIGERKAELQIRTWAQHAWADTLHDRTYKRPLKATAEVERRAALLAAIMEEGDRNFDGLADELDSLTANYATHGDRAGVTEEMALQQLLVYTSADVKERPPLALQLARLLAALGQHREVIELLNPIASQSSACQDELQLELGSALCRLHRSQPSSPEYLRGVALIVAVVSRLAQPPSHIVIDLRRHQSLRARALSKLGWACEIDEAQSSQAGEHHRLALELEPTNPYYLANMLGFELRAGAKVNDLVGCMRPVMLAAIRACESHAAQQIELPFAYFTAGRLRLLLGETEAALQDYFRGTHHCLDERNCAGCEVMDDELAWLYRIRYGQPLPRHARQTKEFLLLARAAKQCAERRDPNNTSIPPARKVIIGPVLIIAGGAVNIPGSILDACRDPLTEALRPFKGTVISGGIDPAFPASVGEIAETLKKSDDKRFNLIGYRPEQLPDDAPRDDRYDKSIPVGDHGFSPEQILANWSDILAAGIQPKDVRLLGLGGGSIAGVEYRMALALGARVGLIQHRKPFGDPPDAVDTLLAHPQWKGFSNLLPLPFDAATLRAFVNEPAASAPANALEQMAKELHARYVIENPKRMTENLRPWEHLPDTYKRANIEQAQYAVEILRAAGFRVSPITGDPGAIKSFEGKEFEADVERMAELEHGRWNVERLRDGWRLGPRNDAQRTHDCLVPWKQLGERPEGVKRFDRQAVQAFPELLGRAGLEIRRPAATR